jgi:dienelactone hydrolase
MRALTTLSRHLQALAACAIASAIFSAPALAQDVVTSFASAQPTGVYAFASWTPKSLPDLLHGNGTDGAVNIVGHLFLPPGTDKVPAVVLVHGSGGIYNAELDFWPKQFNAAGIAVFTLDMFGPRGVKSTADDQSQVPFAADTADTFAALKLLATHPRIDARRIAIMGFSRGGIAALRTDVEKIIASQKLPDGLRYAAIIPTYSGGCSGIFRFVVKPGVFTKAPILFLHGDADDYTPIAACQDYADKIGKAGTPVEFVVLKGAYHKFDGDDQKRYYLRGAQRTKAECVLEVDIDTGYVYDRTTGTRLRDEAYKTAQEACRATGANVEGNAGARTLAATAAIGFLKKTFAN